MRVGSASTVQKDNEPLVRPGGYLHAQEYESSQMMHSDLSGATIEGCKFDDANLRNSNLNGARVIDTKFDNTWLDNSSADDAYFKNASFWGGTSDGMRLRRAWFCDSDISGHSFDESDASYARFDNVNISESHFVGTHFNHARFGACEMKNFISEICSLIDVEMTGCNLGSSVFKKSNLTKAVFQSSKLRKATIERCMLYGADFSGCDLSEASIISCFADGAVFAGAILSNADLSYSVFQDADFSDADLSGADLEGCDLARAKLGGANLYRASYNKYTKWPQGFHPPTTAIDTSRHDAAMEQAREQIFERTGVPHQGVFIDAPREEDPFTLILASFPEFFTLIDRWAFAEQNACVLYNVIEHAASSIRAGDGENPYETYQDKIRCLVYHLHNAITPAQISASADTLSRDKEGRRFKHDKHAHYIYTRLQDEIAAARRRSAKEGKTNKRPRDSQATP